MADFFDTMHFGRMTSDLVAGMGVAKSLRYGNIVFTTTNYYSAVIRKFPIVTTPRKLGFLGIIAPYNKYCAGNGRRRKNGHDYTGVVVGSGKYQGPHM